MDTCECGNDNVLTCEECGRVFCMRCFRKYSYEVHSYLCWQCQNEADLEWLHQMPKHGKMLPLRKRARNHVA